MLLSLPTTKDVALSFMEHCRHSCYQRALRLLQYSIKDKVTLWLEKVSSQAYLFT